MSFGRISRACRRSLQGGFGPKAKGSRRLKASGKGFQLVPVLLIHETDFSPLNSQQALNALGGLHGLGLGPSAVGMKVQDFKV